MRADLKALADAVIQAVRVKIAPLVKRLDDLDGTITDGGELTHSYSVESGGEVKMTKQEIIEMIQRAGFDPVERDTVYNRVAAV